MMNMPSSDHTEKIPLAHRLSSLRNHRKNPKAFPLSRWKENLKASCLENARKRRRELLMKRRLGNDTPVGRSLVTSAEDVLMESLMENSTVMTVGTRHMKPEIISQSDGKCDEVDPNNEAVATTPCNLGNSLSEWEGNELTDDDLYDLLLEIEEELRVDDDELLEEVLEEERGSLEYQASEYDVWECQEDQVLCPLCSASRLRLSLGGEICCDDEYCPMLVRPFDQRNPLTAFKKDLGKLFEEHSSFCNDQIIFNASTNHIGVSILAFCTSCNFRREF